MIASEQAMADALMRYVDTAAADWTEVEPGYRRLPLVNDREAGTRIVLVHYDAGYQLSRLDEHEHDEYLYIVSGTFVDQNQASGPGTFIHNLPGSSHQPSSPDGCTFLAVVTRT
jgi:anti-sigma factor ChrR (cupin superfamily)